MIPNKNSFRHLLTKEILITVSLDQVAMKRFSAQQH